MDRTTVLTSQRVSNIFMDCLYKDAEVVDGKPCIDPIIIEGISTMFGLHPHRVKRYDTEITGMLSELDDTFKKGWSFLNLCMDRHGNQWTGLHNVQEQLMVLGMAVGKMHYVAPRDLWSAMPWGMPYVIVTEGENDLEL